MATSETENSRNLNLSLQERDMKSRIWQMAAMLSTEVNVSNWLSTERKVSSIKLPALPEEGDSSAGEFRCLNKQKEMIE